MDEKEKEKIEKYGLTEMDEAKLFTFTVVLCDNEVDRDNERFSIEALYELSKLFLGKSGIFDHEAKASAQSARIYDTFVEKEETRTTSVGEPYHALKAKAYMVRHKENETLIEEISAGIKKEVSVGCQMGKKICSICGSNLSKEPCEHTKEDGAHIILENALDAYEWSFVVVPAQKEAGVTKKYVWKENDEIEKNSVRLEMEQLQKEAAFGREYRENLLRELMVTALKNHPEVSGEAILGMGEKLSPDEVGLLKKMIATERPVKQLSVPEEEDSTSSYHII